MFRQCLSTVDQQTQSGHLGQFRHIGDRGVAHCPQSGLLGQFRHKGDRLDGVVYPTVRCVQIALSDAFRRCGVAHCPMRSDCSRRCIAYLTEYSGDSRCITNEY
ncbi:hypothetical protein DPMN_183231 [Dreissena polymorpha]|uniref:Uncharacterized protein n=1 Tax=Dreissena polymorpha TaxID=45954 RepID=A0A9D4I667_DREPO|nr:hypothetical protein DPMN_183231 [Dreissena polymorpha]